MADFTPFDPASVDRMQRSQLWDCPDGEKLLDSCKYKLMLSDFLAAGLEYKLRCRMLARWLEIALSYSMIVWEYGSRLAVNCLPGNSC